MPLLLLPLRRFLPLVLAGILLAPSAAFSSEAVRLSVGHNTTNARVKPLGIANEELSFAWALASELRGVRQAAYQLRIGTREGASDVWDSGRVASEQQVDVVPPSGLRLRSATRYYWQVRVWDQNGVGSDWSSPAWFETSLAREEWADATWISHQPASPLSGEAVLKTASLPLLRRVCTLTKPVRSARLYVSAHGLYQMYLNGTKVGDQVLSPGWTDYTKRLQFQTYDVSSLLKAGENVLGAALADGWYRGKVGLNWAGIYGDRLALIAKLRVTFEDGGVEDFVSDGLWRSAEGPFVQADLQDGEHYDAGLEQSGWADSGFNDSDWSPVALVDAATALLVPQPDEPIRETGLLPALARTEPEPGRYIYDFGQNLVGVARIKITGRAGQTILLRHGEELYRQGERRGELYTENLRTAKAIDRYTFARNETVVYQPTFTQHGFRYLELSGLDTPPELAEVQAVVLGSALPDTGDLRVSHPMLDQLVRNIRWGQRGNFLSIPTDTPARDERLGWTGDIAVFASTAARYQDTRAFLSKWMDDLRDAQKPDGNIPAIVPQPRDYFGETGVGWSDAFIVVPYTVWRATGDTQILRKNWEAMRRFYAFVHSSATQDGTLLEEGRHSWFSGDWLSLESVDRLAEHRLIATAYFAENTRMMSEMAGALGHQAQAAEWADLVPRIGEAFVRAYRHADGSLEVGTQTVYALALGMGLIADPEQRVQTATKFVEKLAADQYHLRTGFLGTPWLLPALCKSGREDLAMRLLLNEDYPSWGFEIRMGATTMWERWNTIRADGQFGPVDMNSFNHYAYGAVGDWMFAHLGGVELLEPGYKRFRVAPLFWHQAVPQATCQLMTPRGRITVAWKRENGDLHLKVEVPVNTTAEVVLPPLPLEAVQEGGQPVSSSVGVVVLENNTDKLSLQLESGHYEFLARLPER